MGRFVTLRCRSSETLKLVEALTALGIDAWSPSISMRMRLPRSRTVANVVKPMLPSFVFSKEEALGLIPVPGLPRFGPMKIAGKFVWLTDDQLKGIADAEAAARKIRRSKKPKRTFTLGEVVVIPIGPFQGMKGRVCKIDYNYIELDIENSPFRTQISAFVLSSDAS